MSKPSSKSPLPESRPVRTDSDSEVEKPLTSEEANFFNMELSEPVVTALHDLGWETPTPIQAAAIPLLMTGNDIVGQAQTGTGKTAAFALPILSKIDVTHQVPQVLVLTPTRELCIQVAAVFGQLACGLRGIRVLPVYGGQGFSEQLCALKKGVHIIVGTPGRVMDHMRRKTLKLDHMHFLVLDEADEMLNMGFAEDIEWILEQTSKERQTALFSATMPPEIRRIARKYLRDPEEITIRNATATAENITHRYWITQNYNKFEVLTRILETEEHDGILVFVKTKAATIDIAEALSECGLPASPLNGDMKQTDRERTVNRFKEGRLDILVATDVAARGLDVDRISHVVNYDPPHDTEGYVHRVGRTGRAGRSGQAIIIATPRERRFLAEIERATRQSLTPYEMPSLEAVNRSRIDKFKLRLAEALDQEGCEPFVDIVREFQEETGIEPATLAGALAKMMHGKATLLVNRMPEPAMDPRPSPGRGPRPAYGERRPPVNRDPEPGMDRYRLECGHAHGVLPGNIVGAIANESGLRGKDIGHIDIFEEYSTVDLPAGMPERIFSILKKTRVGSRHLNLSLLIQSKLERKEFSRHGSAEKRISRGGQERPARRKDQPEPRNRRTSRRQGS